MLSSAADIKGCTLEALDGRVGKVQDCVFDEESWLLRYLLVRTGAWHANDNVMVTTSDIERPDWPEKSLSVALSRSDLQSRFAPPDIQKRLYHSSTQDPHTSGSRLHSANAVMGYRVLASDGDLGQLLGLLIDERSWAIRYMIIQTSTWWLGQQVLIAPEWVDAVRWPDSVIVVDMTRLTIQNSPSYEDGVRMKGTHEAGIYHYGGLTE